MAQSLGTSKEILGCPNDRVPLSAAEVRVHLRLGTSLAAVDGHDVFSALPCPWHSTLPCCHAFVAVGTSRVFIRLLRQSRLVLVEHTVLLNP